MKILGIMSGSSLDGIDLALCEFKENQNKISWKILKATTVEYSAEWIEKLKFAPETSARDLTLLDYHLGYLIGEESKRFLDGEKIDYLSSHGHTVFHEPHNKMTCQIGNGSAIAAASEISTIYDYRSMDIGYGGHGAPIVAILDRDLFPQYTAMVNLGGISNISITINNKTIAYDISPCNQLLNFLAQQLGLEYDKDGEIASNGNVNEDLLNELLSFDYFNESFPKSLDNNFIKNNFIPILKNSKIDLKDKMATSVELIAVTLAETVVKNISSKEDNPKILFAGGGAKNKFLMQRITELCKNASIVIPDEIFIDYKEALMMAYIGFLRILKRPNVLSTVTGASIDSIGGAVCFSKS